MPPLTIALLGCGAITRHSHAPALHHLQNHENLAQVTALLDPSPENLAPLRALFPHATILPGPEHLTPHIARAALVATPATLHAPQSIALLRQGLHVLCEKPMAHTLPDAIAMTDTARDTGLHLAIGLSKRFHPAFLTLRHLLSQNTFGPLHTYHLTHGAPFGWPAASDSFFRKSTAGGGVLLDLGIHLLDLLLWSLDDPEPQLLHYADDSLGGLENNAHLTLRHPRLPHAPTGEIRLSRDTHLPDSLQFHCQHATLTATLAHTTQLHIQLKGHPHPLRAQTLHPSQPDTPAPDHPFLHQLRNFIHAINGAQPLLTPAHSALPPHRLIAHAYAHRHPLPAPWLTPEEQISIIHNS